MKQAKKLDKYSTALDVSGDADLSGIVIFSKILNKDIYKNWLYSFTFWCPFGL